MGRLLSKEDLNTYTEHKQFGRRCLGFPVHSDSTFQYYGSHCVQLMLQLPIHQSANVLLNRVRTPFRYEVICLFSESIVALPPFDPIEKISGLTRFPALSGDH
jgi:hypothetical protein